MFVRRFVCIAEERSRKKRARSLREAGQFAIASARLLGAGRIFAIDSVASRLALARVQGAEGFDFEREDPVVLLTECTTRSIGGSRGHDLLARAAFRWARSHDPSVRTTRCPCTVRSPARKPALALALST